MKVRIWLLCLALSGVIGAGLGLATRPRTLQLSEDTDALNECVERMRAHLRKVGSSMHANYPGSNGDHEMCPISGWPYIAPASDDSESASPSGIRLMESLVAHRNGAGDEVVVAGFADGSVKVITKEELKAAIHVVWFHKPK